MTNKIVFIPGAWDLFHIGHLRILKRARELAKHLIVGVDDDESVKERKGYYPIVPFEQRRVVLDALEFVDQTVRHKNAIINPSMLQKLGVEVLVLGSDWKGKDMPGLKEARKLVKVIYFPYSEEISTTKLKQKIRRAAREATQ